MHQCKAFADFDFLRLCRSTACTKSDDCELSDEPILSSLVETGIGN